VRNRLEAEAELLRNATSPGFRVSQPEQNCHRLGLNLEMNTTFDWLEADDRGAFRRQAVLM
jgi:hypothetical protein